MTNPITKLTPILLNYTVSNATRTTDIAALDFNELKAVAVPPVNGSPACVALVHRNTPKTNLDITDAQLLIDISDTNGINELLTELIKAKVFEQMAVEDPDETLDDLVLRGLRNSNITIDNLVSTVINKS